MRHGMGSKGGRRHGDPAVAKEISVTLAHARTTVYATEQTAAQRASTVRASVCPIGTGRPIGDGCRRTGMGRHEIEPRPFLSLHNEFQHGPQDNVGENPARIPERHGKGLEGGSARKRIPNREQGSRMPVFRPSVRIERGLRSHAPATRVRGVRTMDRLDGPRPVPGDSSPTATNWGK